mgnify:CR=1 FL=1
MSYNRLIQIDGKVAKPSKRNLITEVAPGSPAELAGIKAQDRLLKINDVLVKDILDYRYLTAAESFSLIIQRETEVEVQNFIVDIEKDTYEELGLSFETGILDQANSCSNNCVFCFIDQLPQACGKPCILKTMILGCLFYKAIL